MMKLKKLNIYGVLFLFLSTIPFVSYADDGLGQLIHINTRFSSLVGRPSWLIVIRDIDHGQNLPFIYDITRSENAWVLATSGRNYEILASTLQFAPYRYDVKNNRYTQRTVNNFCGLESRGRIIRGESMTITVSGRLTPNTNTFSCNVLRYPQ